MKRLNRRDMLRLIGLSATGAVLASCAPAQQPTTAPETKSGENTGKPTATTEKAAEAPAPTTAVVKGDPIEIKLVECWFGLPQNQDVLNEMNAMLSDKMQSEGLNITVKSIVLDDHTNQYPAMYATQADFTMAWDAQWVIMNQLRDDGSIMPIEDLIQQYGPHILEKYDATILEFNRYSKDKHLYGLPIYGIYGEPMGIMLRDDLREKYGAPMPEGDGTLEAWLSLEPFLEAVAGNEKRMIPFGNVSAYAMPGNSITAYPDGSPSYILGLQGGGTFGLSIYDARNAKFENIEDVPNGMRAAEIRRSWWEKGWMNKDDIAPTSTIQAEFLATGKIASNMMNGPQTGLPGLQAQIQQSFPDARLAAVDMTGLLNGKQKPQGNRKQWNWYVWNANAPQEQQVAGMQFMDWIMSSQENIDLWTFGVEGKNYKAGPDNTFTEIEGIDPTTNYRRDWYISGVPMKYLRVPANMSETEKQVREASLDVNRWRFMGPFETFTWDWDSAAVEDLVTKLNGVAQEASFGLNTGQMATEEGIKKMKELLDGAGRQELKDALNRQLEAFVKANQAEVDAWLSEQSM